MWEYQKETIIIKDFEDKYIIDEMNKFGKSGWEIITVIETRFSDKHYDDIITSTIYKLYMKRKI